jgi:signal transduction histidine kinase
MAETGAGTASERLARVLLVQDEAEERRGVAGALRRAGFEVVEVGSGLAGIEAATSVHPDLLLLDLHLPDLDGAEVASKLRRLGLDGLPIVAMGQAGAERGLALSAGCDGTIPSPPNLERLPGQLREFLAGKRDRLRGGDEKRFLKVLNQSLVEKLEAKVRELTAANERMLRVDAFKTEFMHSISHELSSPLTPLAGYLKILHGEKLGPLTDRQKRVVESMMQSADRLSRTIDNLADFAVLETGTYRVRSEPVKAVAVAEHLVESLQTSTAKQKRVHLELVARDPELTLSADPSRLAQALSNLIENAVNVSPHGGEVLIEIRALDGFVRFAIYDQGPGIPPEDQPRIFEPFFQARDARHAAIVGLGLPVARKIAEAHGGRVLVESPPKEAPETERHFSGSRLVLELPIAPLPRGERPRA